MILDLSDCLKFLFMLINSSQWTNSNFLIQESCEYELSLLLFFPPRHCICTWYQFCSILFRWLNLTAIKRLVDTNTLKIGNSSFSEVKGHLQWHHLHIFNPCRRYWWSYLSHQVGTGDQMLLHKTVVGSMIKVCLICRFYFGSHCVNTLFMLYF